MTGNIWVSGDWADYELLDAGYGEKLERWGRYVLRRPDPQAIWPAVKDAPAWRAADAVYHRSASGGGSWEFINKLPPSWEINYGQLRFTIKPMQFKHTGLFPEQAVNWDWAIRKIISRKARPETARVLNLFAYTGGATVAAASVGADVCHVDAARGIVAIAKENALLSHIPDDKIRYIVDDVVKFARRETRRGSKYDAVIMDPPSYGRGPGGELWKAEDHLYDVVRLCTDLLNDPPLFFILNSYAAGISAAAAGNILHFAVTKRFGGLVECGELGIPAKSGAFSLPCGCCARWERDR
jgi:23S rRNA (cytosine1962-C5)-methyltransferase